MYQKDQKATPSSTHFPFPTALVVGRWQPFHNGHLYLIKETLKISKRAIIVVGSSNATDKNNPLNYQDREKLLKKVIGKEKIADRVAKIFALPDYPDDKTWVKELVRRAGEFQVVIGNNEWTNRVLQQAGYQVITIPELDRQRLQGTAIRQSVKQNRTWQDKVPNYLADDLEKLLPSS